MSGEEHLHKQLTDALARRKMLELDMAENVGEIYHTVTHPAVIIKNCVRDLAKDNDFRADLGKIALHAVTSGFTGSGKAGIVAKVVSRVIGLFSRK